MKADKLKRILAGMTVAGLLSTGGVVYAKKTAWGSGGTAWGGSKKGAVSTTPDTEKMDPAKEKQTTPDTMKEMEQGKKMAPETEKPPKKWCEWASRRRALGRPWELWLPA